MAIVENITSELGDTLIIKVDVPIIGIITLTDFVDTVLNESGTRFFTKKFRYSTDGVNFTPFMDLTNDNISLIEIRPTDTFLVEYRYTRSGTDTVDALGFQDVTLNGEFELQECGPVYKESIFAQFCDCSCTCSLNWAINVLEKLYKSGIVPSYIERDGNKENPFSDRDYLDFWRSITTMFAYIVCYARNFGELSQNDILLSKYLKSKSLFIDENKSDTLPVLRFLMKSFYSEIASRGTIKIAKKYNGPEGEGADGELLRLISYNKDDEFIFALTKTENFGWCIGNSSPLYKNLVDQKYINKSYEDSKDIVNINNYPILNLSLSSLVSDSDKIVLQSKAIGSNTKTGIGLDYDNIIITEELISKAINVSSKLNYLISFDVRQPIQIKNTLTFGVIGLDKNNNIISFKKVLDETNNNLFFQRQKLNRTDYYYTVEGVIYNKDQEILDSENSKLNIGFGSNLIFGSEDVVKIIPIILADSGNSFTGNGTINIWNVKVRILNSEYSTGFLNSNNFIKCWMNNNNMNYSEDEIDNIIRKFLIPYNSNFKSTYINTLSNE